MTIILLWALQIYTEKILIYCIKIPLHCVSMGKTGFLTLFKNKQQKN